MEAIPDDGINYTIACSSGVNLRWNLRVISCFNEMNATVKRVHEVVAHTELPLLKTVSLLTVS